MKFEYSLFTAGFASLAESENREFDRDKSKANAMAKSGRVGGAIYQMSADEHLASFCVFNHLWGRNISTRMQMLAKLKKMSKEEWLPGEQFDAAHFLKHKRVLIEDLYTQVQAMED